MQLNEEYKESIQDLNFWSKLDWGILELKANLRLRIQHF